MAIVALSGVSIWELGVMTRVFESMANRAYEVVVCGAEPGIVRSDTGIDVIVRQDIRSLDRIDILAIPSATTAAACPLRMDSFPAARRTAACGTGVFTLAALGLLDGRTVTTTWSDAERLAASHPGLTVDCEALFVDDGDTLTSAGGGAVVDLCLHLIRRDHGAAAANEIARRLLFPPRRMGGQSVYIPSSAAEPDCGGSTAPTRTWARDHLRDPLTLSGMAVHARMSIRTFTRRFREETGTSPRNWLIRQRIEHARRLLESTDLPVEHLADAAGFGSPESFRQQFRMRFGVGPQSYRYMFAGDESASPSCEHPCS